LFASQNFSPRLTNHIIKIAKQKKVDPILVYAVMHQESGFRLDAGSHAGAKGLMQVMPFHFKHCGVSNGFNAYQNTTCGIGILADALQDANGDLKIALSLYNSGKKSGYLRFKETKNYVASINSHYNKLKGA
jgi:soluble lytic murein transglycosylase-like protein